MVPRHGSSPLIFPGLSTDGDAGGATAAATCTTSGYVLKQNLQHVPLSVRRFDRVANLLLTEDDVDQSGKAVGQTVDLLVREVGVHDVLHLAPPSLCKFFQCLRLIESR